MMISGPMIISSTLIILMKKRNISKHDKNLGLPIVPKRYYRVCLDGVHKGPEALRRQKKEEI